MSISPSATFCWQPKVSTSASGARVRCALKERTFAENSFCCASSSVLTNTSLRSKMIFLQNEYFNSYNIAQIGSGDKPSNGKQGKF